METIDVKCCKECPFSRYGEDDESWVTWYYCDFFGSQDYYEEDGHLYGKREEIEKHCIYSGADETRPDWCPLPIQIKGI